jgi:Cu+-exporting ATPase
LITLGSSAAFFYSISGWLLYGNSPDIHDFLFFETAASIVTLIFVGNLIEQRAVKKTTSSIQSLSSLQPPTAKKVSRDSGHEIIETIPVEDIKLGEYIRVNEGDRVPVDGKIVQGNCTLDESMMTGESLPVQRGLADNVTTGTLCTSGSITFEVTAVGQATTLAHIIDLVKNAQHDKPEIQRLGDKISAIFVPVVIIISLLTFIISYWIIGMGSQDAIMHAVAVLVISCPCAMGLATPTAVMVGIGRAARNGILIKGGSTIEHLAHIKTVVFDKTGTLTNGDFKIEKIAVLEGDESVALKALFHIEQNSSHPIAASIVRELKKQSEPGEPLLFSKIQEDKGIGINGWDHEGNLYSAGSYVMAKHLTNDDSHAVYLLKNNRLIATVDLIDTIKPDTKTVISRLKQAGIRVVLLSGDREESCKKVAAELGIDEYYSRQLPSDKLKLLKSFSSTGKTVMVGDGINDAPALAAATVGVSLSNAADVAIQSAQVVLLQQEQLDNLLRALEIGRLTYSTIRQNLFWAFFYNVIAIPFAAAGFLSPMIGALSMALSDVMVIGNSLRLNIRPLKLKSNP